MNGLKETRVGFVRFYLFSEGKDCPNVPLLVCEVTGPKGIHSGYSREFFEYSCFVATGFPEIL